MGGIIMEIEKLNFEILNLRPTKEGWYWWRFRNTQKWVAMEVIDYVGTLMAAGKTLDELGGEWGDLLSPDGSLRELLALSKNLNSANASSQIEGMVGKKLDTILNRWTGEDDG